MAERAKLWVYFAFGVIFTLIYWSPRTGSGARTAGSSRRGCRTSPARRSSTTRARSPALAGALILGPRIGKFGTDGRANPIPGHNLPYAVLGTLILWFGWFGFNPGSTLSVDFGGFGYFAYVALTTNLAAAAGALGGVSTAWIVLKKPDISMMLNGVLAALVAITAASGFVAPWAAVVIGLVSGVDRGRRRDLRRADRHRRPDRRGRGARHVRRLGHARHRPVRRAGAREEPRDRHGRSLLHRLVPPARRAGARPRSRSARSPSRASFGVALGDEQLWGIRVEDDVETAGLDVSEHGMWGYPEFYIPVPGGYGADAQPSRPAARAGDETGSHATGGRLTMPPATAGSSSTFAPGRTGVSRPCRRRMSSPSRNTLMNARHSAPFERGRRVTDGRRRERSIASPTVAPSTATVRWPPVSARRTGGMRISIMLQKIK